MLFSDIPLCFISWHTNIVMDIVLLAIRFVALYKHIAVET